MTTFKEMVDDTLLHLSGYGMRNEAVTYIPSAITSTTGTTPNDSIQVFSAENIGRGLIEIDDELIWVDGADRTTGNLVTFPFSRGYAGTTAISHAANTKVVISPTFTRQQVKKALNDTILSVSGRLYGVDTSTFTYSPAVNTYALPTAFSNMLTVSFKTIGPSKQWLPVRSYRVDKTANVASFGSPHTITLLRPLPAGVTVQVAYTTEASTLEADTDDFSLTTNFPESCKDVIILGAAYRLLSFIDPARLNYQAAEANANSNTVQYGSGTNAAKYVYALFQQRLQEEISKLQFQEPLRVHFSN